MTDNSRPYIICYMAPSVDGRLIFDRFSKSFYNWDQDKGILEFYDRVGIEDLKSNVVILGRNTYYTDFCQKLYDIDSHKTPASKFELFKGKISDKGFMIILDSKGKSIYEDKMLSEYNFISILSEKVSEDYLQYLRSRNVSYVFAGSDGNNFEKALITLKSMFGFERILLEGGGVVNGSFLKLKLIDEIALMLMPSIDGNASKPSIFEYHGNPDEFPAAGQKLELIDSKALSYGILLIRYKVHRE